MANISETMATRELLLGFNSFRFTIRYNSHNSKLKYGTLQKLVMVRDGVRLYITFFNQNVTDVNTKIRGVVRVYTFSKPKCYKSSCHG